MRETHGIPPVFREDSRVLILGSFPSVKSREVGFFYGHPQNRFWRTLAAVLEDEIPTTADAKKAFVLRHGIALWDVIESCEITGSSDASIRNAVPNDLPSLLRRTRIERIYTNGGTAHRLYEKYWRTTLGRDDICLPSTSPANAAWTQDRLIDAWQVIKE